MSCGTHIVSYYIVYFNRLRQIMFQRVKLLSEKLFQLLTLASLINAKYLNVNYNHAYEVTRKSCIIQFRTSISDTAFISATLPELILSDGKKEPLIRMTFIFHFFAGANSLVRSGLCEEGQLFTVELLQGFVRSIKKSDVYQPMSQIIQLLGPELGFKRQR